MTTIPPNSNPSVFLSPSLPPVRVPAKFLTDFFATAPGWMKGATLILTCLILLLCGFGWITRDHWTGLAQTRQDLAAAKEELAAARLDLKNCLHARLELQRRFDTEHARNNRLEADLTKIKQHLQIR